VVHHAGSNWALGHGRCDLVSTERAVNLLFKGVDRAANTSILKPIKVD
jgi:hypothetical protein